MIWNETIECMDREEMRKLQSIRLKRVVEHVYHNTPFYRKKMQEMGAANVLVSMAGEGAVLIAADGQSMGAPAPKGTLVNGVGAGDSMVAGFLTGWMEKKDYVHAFHMGIAAGSASAFSENLATREEVLQVLQQVEQ